MVLFGEPAAVIHAQLTRAKARLKQARRIQRQYAWTYVLIIVGLWIIANLRIFRVLRDPTPEDLAGVWDSTPQRSTEFLLDQFGVGYPIFLLVASFLQISCLGHIYFISVNAETTHLQRVMWLHEIARSVADGRRSRQWVPWLQHESQKALDFRSENASLRRIVIGGTFVLVGCFTCVYLPLFVVTLGKYPSLTVFVFPALQLLSVGLLTSVRYKYQVTEERLRFLLQTGLTTSFQGRSMKGTEMEDSRFRTTSVESVYHRNDAQRDESATRADVSFESSANAIEPVQVDSNGDEADMSAQLAEAGRMTSTQSDDTSSAVQLVTLSPGAPVRQPSASAIAMRMTIMSNPAARERLNAGFSFKNVLAFLPRLLGDAVIVSAGFLVIVAIRAYIGYPNCSKTPEQIEFVGEPSDCSPAESDRRAIESAVVAFVSEGPLRFIRPR